METSINTSKAIRVVVVDDDREVRNSILWLLDGYNGLKCVGAFKNCHEVMESIEACKPDVVLMDESLPGETGVDCTKKLLAVLPKTKVLIHSSFSIEERLLLAKASGAAGFIPKNAGTQVLADAIREAHSGVLLWPEGFAEGPSPNQPQQSLRARLFSRLLPLLFLLTIPAGL